VSRLQLYECVLVWDWLGLAKSSSGQLLHPFLCGGGRGGGGGERVPVGTAGLLLC